MSLFMNDFLKFWQTDQPVFLRSVSANEIFLTDTMRAAVERLLLIAQQPQTLSILTGSHGSGKSTLLRWLNTSLPTQTHETLLTTMISAEKGHGWLSPRLAEFFGLPPSPSETLSQTHRVVAQFDELRAENRRLLIIIDAAHLGQTAEAWQEVVGILSLQALADPCVSFLLCGDPTLGLLFEQIAALGTSLSHVAELAPLSAEETGAYINHRLQVAKVSAEFAATALQLVARESQGIIARINALCENILVEAAARSTHIITDEVVNAATKYLHTKSPHPHSKGGLATSALSEKSSTVAPTPAKLANPELISSHEPPQKPLTTAYGPSSTAVAPKSSSTASSTSSPPISSPLGETAASPHDQSPSNQQDVAGIKLASLFKSEPSRRRP